jgi:hypothetical protein
MEEGDSMSTSSKGRSRELKCMKELQKEGYTIVFRSIRTRFQRIDFANQFDVVGFKTGAKRRYIQVKSQDCPTNKILRGILGWVSEFGIPSECYELWIYRPRKHWRKILITKDNFGDLHADNYTLD